MSSSEGDANMTISSVVDRGEVSGQIKVYFALVVNVAIDLGRDFVFSSLDWR